MLWTKQDMQVYIKQKEYIDTAIIPIIPFQLSHENDMDKSTSKREVLSIFATVIEKELSGRVLLIPNYYYLEYGDKAQEVDRLNRWTEEIQKQPFKHVFIVTFDSSWKKFEKELEANLLWLPGFQADDLYDGKTQQLIQGQVQDVVELIRSYW
ncbi:DUF2487 family protein [Ornithinibacillus bavariensis]|uniref:DUF2487 family protein n=1 Tax=Ornithinibacillus bavariensis TaxID=545502 RepID=UPI000EE04217|nr:DUF2487 domain-containing protein [Ornithinibacillus sp.]